ncbi:MAG: hypothetical protein ACRDH2_16305, partial [Anaerolineales bacterium]
MSFEISAANADPAWQDAPVSIYAGSLEGEPLATGKFGQFGIGGRAQATFFWAWNTRNLVGPQTLFVTVDPEKKEGAEVAPGQQGQVLSLTVNLLPAEQRPMPEPLARWAQTESACCVFHYLTGAAAARDIEIIKAQADEAFAHIESVLDVKSEKKVGFTLLSRLLGHGGFASDEISVTYVDRNPAGNNVPNVFAHEGTHILDRQIAQTRPALLTEGLAVYVAGGHFKPEDLEKRAAALLALERYIPLEKLANDFYPAQHETGYLEGGALVTFLIDRYGWDRFKKFYGSFEEADSDAKMLDEALRANFDISLSDLEAEWLAHLRSLPTDPAQVDDLRLTIGLYDTLRRYQNLNDPAAYFLTAWLPNAGEARRRGIVADFVRHPTAPENLALETMLVDARRALAAGEFATTEKLLNSVNAVLDAHNLFHDPLAADYLEIVIDVADTG